MSDKAKIIFPSTHVIFEGLKSTKLNITENEQPSTFLAYSSSKVNNEQQIIKSGKNYIILRLGSVYGFSGDSTINKYNAQSFFKNRFSKWDY